MTDTENLLERLSKSFGGLRAEYLRDELYSLFTQPTYWPELLTTRPCLLVGGRGTGKTTVLRGLSYEGQAHLNAGGSVASWPGIGLYWRLDTSVTTAFEGGYLNESDWTPLFGHYVNLVLVQMLTEFICWYEQVAASTYRVRLSDLAKVARAMHLKEAPKSGQDLLNATEDAIIDLEAYVNNATPENRPKLSRLAAPVNLLVDALSYDPILASKTVFFLLDEYENLADYQQRVFNTLIKHAGDSHFTFKIGMRQTGHRERRTLNADETLIEPADYAYVDISEKLKNGAFAEFALGVCNERLARVLNVGTTVERDRAVQPSISEFLKGLTDREEAELLGVRDRVSTLRRELLAHGASDDLLTFYDGLDPLSAYLVSYWSKAQSTDILTVLKFSAANPTEWQRRLGNYQRAMLFTLRSGIPGRVRKYYSGWNVYLKLADGNIRYLLQLVVEALTLHVQAEESLDAQNPVSATVQTEAAQQVGGRILRQMQGVAVEGGQLTKLVLSLGRIFGVMAAQPEGHTPETTQFRVTGGEANALRSREAEAILTAAVMHLAVVRFDADKMAGISSEVKGFDYQLHPIFAPFFIFSYRSKRRMNLSEADIVDLINRPKLAIRAVLRRSDRLLDNADLPDQLLLFRDFYDAAN